MIVSNKMFGWILIYLSLIAIFMIPLAVLANTTPLGGTVFVMVILLVLGGIFAILNHMVEILDITDSDREATITLKITMVEYYDILNPWEGIIWWKTIVKNKDLIISDFPIAP